MEVSLAMISHNTPLGVVWRMAKVNSRTAHLTGYVSFLRTTQVAVKGSQIYIFHFVLPVIHLVSELTFSMSLARKRKKRRVSSSVNAFMLKLVVQM